MARKPVTPNTGGSRGKKKPAKKKTSSNSTLKAAQKAYKKSKATSKKKPTAKQMASAYRKAVASAAPRSAVKKKALSSALGAEAVRSVASTGQPVRNETRQSHEKAQKASKMIAATKRAAGIVPTTTPKKVAKPAKQEQAKFTKTAVTDVTKSRLEKHELESRFTKKRY